MKRMGRLSLLLVVIISVVFSAELCSASGFALYEASARGNALAGALVARADDPSALFFNPAGITQLPGLQMMAGATVIMPSTKVTTNSPKAVTTRTDDNTWIPAHLYATYQATDKVWLGLGVFSPFGLGTEFSPDWPGRYNSYEAVIKTVVVNPNIAFKVNDKFSFALGLDLMWFDLDLKRKIDTKPFGGFGDVNRELNGDSLGMGFNVAFHGQPYDWLKLGFSYRSQVTQNVTGDAKFIKPAKFPSVPPFSSAFNNTTATGSITLPDELFFGAAFYPIKDFSVEVGAIWTRWSTYEALTIRYNKPPLPGGGTVYSDPKDWNDVWRPFIGFEYKAADWLDLRAGYAFDQEAINNVYADYLVPANNRHLFSVGPGFHWQNWTLDLSYSYLLITNRDNVPAHEPGVLPSSFSNGYANMVGVSLGYKF
jgi:long-chain fatty acid transport protein